MLVSERIDNDISSTNYHFILRAQVTCAALSIALPLHDLLQVLLVLHPYPFLLPHYFYGLAVSLVLFDDFLDGDHADELLFFVDSLLFGLHLDILVEALYESLIAVQAGVEVAHEELYDHL